MSKSIVSKLLMESYEDGNLNKAVVRHLKEGLITPLEYKQYFSKVYIPSVIYAKYVYSEPSDVEFYMEVLNKNLDTPIKPYTLIENLANLGKINEEQYLGLMDKYLTIAV